MPKKTGPVAFVRRSIRNLFLVVLGLVLAGLGIIYGFTYLMVHIFK